MKAKVNDFANAVEMSEGDVVERKRRTKKRDREATHSLLVKKLVKVNTARRLCVLFNFRRQQTIFAFHRNQKCRRKEANCKIFVKFVYCFVLKIY